MGRGNVREFAAKFTRIEPLRRQHEVFILPKLQLFQHDTCELGPQNVCLGEDFAFLPQSLTRIDLFGDMDIKDEHLALLPPRLLKFCALRVAGLTSDALRFLPTHCQLDGSENEAFSAQNHLSQRMKGEPLQEPDPRVLGLPFKWN